MVPMSPWILLDWQKQIGEECRWLLNNGWIETEPSRWKPASSHEPASQTLSHSEALDCAVVKEAEKAGFRPVGIAVYSPSFLVPKFGLWAYWRSPWSYRLYSADELRVLVIKRNFHEGSVPSFPFSERTRQINRLMRGRHGEWGDKQVPLLYFGEIEPNRFGYAFAGFEDEADISFRIAQPIRGER